ncbi:MAG: hypothetical protein NTW17_01560 [Candidatus Pacearchaeota archaeon]|nr:hypothetical protein [Candidatus Pacearchaeota archaeon]
MACPLYKGGAECGEHSEYYVLSEKTVRTLCTSSDFESCPERIKHQKEELEQRAQSQPKLMASKGIDLPDDYDFQGPVRPCGVAPGE